MGSFANIYRNGWLEHGNHKVLRGFFSFFYTLYSTHSHSFPALGQPLLSSPMLLLLSFQSPSNDEEEGLPLSSSVYTKCPLEMVPNKNWAQVAERKLEEKLALCIFMKNSHVVLYFKKLFGSHSLHISLHIYDTKIFRVFS